jgi:hypothetical protein
MSKFELTIELDNDAWRTDDDAIDAPYLAAAIREVAANARLGDTEGRVIDANGNFSGSWAITEEDN